MKKIISVVLVLIMISSAFCFNVSASTKIPGDANGDKNVSATDARMVLQHVAETRVIEDTTNLDMNKDGNISATDARIILQIVAGLIDPVKEEQLAIFVKSFNDVKKNASSATLVTVNIYEAEEYSGSELFRQEYEDMMSDMVGEQVVNETYTGEDIAANFPPVGATCSLKYSDVQDFSFVEDGDYYLVSFKVKGETNPTRGKGVGAVSNIVTQEELEAEMRESVGSDMTDEEFKTYFKVNSRYKDVVVKAKIEKSTGNMVEYYVDTPLVMEMSMANALEINIGLGSAETWTIAY